MDEVVRQIRTFILENFLFGADEKSLDDEDSFLEKGIIDSTGILEVVGWIEEKFGFQVADEELVPENFDSVSRLAAFISANAQARVA
ncbi:MAG: acyl carrier protein [Deltaproteobacteria bacterium]|nr:acyl carrier protein [Deltaproteobacteria bacterium]